MAGVGFRAFEYPLEPTVGQRAALERLLDLQRELYNAALEERRGAWRLERRSVTRFDQYRGLTGMADIRPDLLVFGARVARGTLLRLDRAFQGFFRRVKAGDTPGFPRFKGAGRFDSVEYPDQSSWKVNQQTRRLYLQGVGHMKVRLHRPLRGVPKTICVRREGRRWKVVVFCADVPAQPLPATGETVGIDLGIDHLATTSRGEHIANPRPGKQLAAKLATAQGDLGRKQRGSNRRRKVVARLGAVHRQAARQRKDWAHQVSRRLVDAYDVIVHEELHPSNMVRRPAVRADDEGGFEPNGAAAKAGLNRWIHDAAWGQLLRLVAYKAEDAGRQLIAVNAANTSRTCHSCGHVAAGNRHGAVFRCLACGHQDHADINAARNILRAGLAQREAHAERAATQVA